MVAACGVAEFLGEVRQHRFDDARIDRRGRVIIHVNRQLNGHIPSSPKSSAQRARARAALRSEEHTSELQSPCNLVCRLLLEKKKINPPAHVSISAYRPLSTFYAVSTLDALPILPAVRFSRELMHPQPCWCILHCRINCDSCY